MTATDKKLRRKAQAIGDSFAAIRRRTARSLAWLSLGAPAIKISVELRLRLRSTAGHSNNGELFVSLLECEQMLGLCRTSAVRGFAELEAKGFIAETRKGEAGRLPKSATTENGGEGFSRRATMWALTDWPWDGHAATHAYEKLTAEDLKRINRELAKRFDASRQMGTGTRPKKQLHVYGTRTHKRTGALPIDPEMGTGDRPVAVESAPKMGTGDRPPVSTIYKAAPNGSTGPRLPWGTLREKVLELLRTEARVWTRKEIVAALGLKYPEDAQRVLGKLRKMGAAERVGHGQYRARPGAELPRLRSRGQNWPAAERMAAGLSQKQLAALIGADRAYISTMEQGKFRPSAERRAAIERALAGKLH
jgi:hypothetical protein